MFFSVIWDARAWIREKYAPFMSPSDFWDCMLCSVIRIVSMETSSSFAATWIFTAVSGETPRPSVMVERFLSGRGVVKASDVDAGEDSGFWEGESSGDFVDDGAADGTGSSVGLDDSIDPGGSVVGIGVGVMAGVGVGSSVGWGDSTKVTMIVWLL